jgi:predicted RNA-binding Zn-ribbon protein involved in translation (DUF1610 family)
MKKCRIIFSVFYTANFKDKSGICQTPNCGKRVHRRTNCKSNGMNYYCKACGDRRFQMRTEMLAAEKIYKAKRIEEWKEKTTSNAIQYDLNCKEKTLRFKKLPALQMQ